MFGSGRGRRIARTMERFIWDEFWPGASVKALKGYACSEFDMSVDIIFWPSGR